MAYFLPCINDDMALHLLNVCNMLCISCLLLFLQSPLTCIVLGENGCHLRCMPWIFIKIGGGWRKCSCSMLIWWGGVWRWEFKFKRCCPLFSLVQCSSWRRTRGGIVAFRWTTTSLQTVSRAHLVFAVRVEAHKFTTNPARLCAWCWASRCDGWRGR